MPVYDLAIIGGGINGVGIARDAAGRGLSVFLCERGDLAQGTSSASSKLIHGGLRYLEHKEFRLVKEALAERETLMRLAPHIIRPLDFCLPYGMGMRPAWMLRAGLFIYDHLASRRTLPSSRSIKLAKNPVYGLPLQPFYTKAFRYTDCWVDDARLVVLNAMDAREHGAEIFTYTTCTGAIRKNGVWKIWLHTQAGEQVIYARALVNAAGPWAMDVLENTGVTASGRIRKVKGSHIVVPRLHDGDHAYILQMADKRIIFILPFEEEFSIIGTTDVPYEGDATEAAISEEEITYLLQGANEYLRQPVRREDIVWSYSGVRALFDNAEKDPSLITRDYVLEVDMKEGAPLLSVFGGKLTTYRTLAERAMEKLTALLPDMSKTTWTHTRPLPGGEVPAEGVNGFIHDVTMTHPWLPEPLLQRWIRQYGMRCRMLLERAGSLEGLGEEFAPGVYERELQYAYEQEFARTGEDFLWRRTKLGLTMKSPGRRRIREWFEERTALDYTSSVNARASVNT